MIPSKKNSFSKRRRVTAVRQEMNNSLTLNNGGMASLTAQLTPTSSFSRTRTSSTRSSNQSYNTSTHSSQSGYLSCNMEKTTNSAQLQCLPENPEHQDQQPPKAHNRIPDPPIRVLLAETKNINSVAYQKMMAQKDIPAVKTMNRNIASTSTQTNLLRDRVDVPETILERQETSGSSTTGIADAARNHATTTNRVKMDS